MGVSTPLTPTRVADSFVGVYYRVISAIPARLPELYGIDSELHHGTTLVAHGPPAIGAIASQLPLAKASAIANVASIAVQTGASGGFVVTVVGTFRKKDNPAAIFSQTFVLEKQSHSHDDHFFCRNDIFIDLSVAPLPGGPPPPIQDSPPVPPAQPVQTQNQQPDRPDTKLPAPNAPPSAPQTRLQEEHAPPVAQPVTEDGTLPAEPPVVEEPQFPDDKLNGTVDQHGAVSESPQQISPAQQQPPPPPQQVPVTQDEPSLPPSAAIPSVTAASEEHVLPPVEPPAPTVPSPPAAKKTWASIVSSQEEAAAAAKAKEALATPKSVNVAPSDVPKQAVENALAQPPVSEQVENIPPTVDADSSGKAPAPPSSHASRSAPASQNGHRPSHVGGRGHPRTFGPSAVVQLAALGPQQLQDPRVLTANLREEFGQYGHKLRHVDVKPQKGIAFIEYESAEGVRAAVAAWANGAREEGLFAGIPLNVTEKRPYNKWRPGSARGGRGGARGGRRNRPASTPIS